MVIRRNWLYLVSTFETKKAISKIFTEVLKIVVPLTTQFLIAARHYSSEFCFENQICSEFQTIIHFVDVWYLDSYLFRYIKK